ncbi:MAG TPA: lamin tail domain-containing protein [Arenimonas sp.]|uniref:lamin tail domain-containing protein n=1 Tax=Arenimonas sp. TaxID=1872635 RepID=UPI002C645719|nr:lamin tail domain-containing protein [Arenimonas sp.]HMB58210.1 lamin tail domain-containing protein [Arenimonas sp.]
MFDPMRRSLWLSVVVLALLAPCAQAQVVISQVYGGGGNSGAQYKNDFIELFNAGATTVSLSGYSVQYSSATGTTWAKTDLTGSLSLAPGQYFLVQEAAGAGVQPALPTPDSTGTLAMSGTTGKVALVANGTLLSGACPAAVDMVGFGPTATCPTTPAAPTALLSNSTAAIRNSAGCATNTGSSSTDFTIAAPTPRNKAATLNPCAGSGGPPNLSIDDVSVVEGDAGSHVATFTVSLSAAAPVGGVSFNIATADGSATTADSDYVGRASSSQSIAAGSSSLTFAVTINGDTAVESSETFLVNIDSVVGANATDVQGLGTIQNDDFIILPIHAIQGSGSVSPFAVNTIIATEGIVTARTSNGFFMQAPDAEADADVASSEGVFVFTSAAPPASAAVGNRVRVNASIDEYNPGGQLPLTELKNATVIQLSTGNTLPSAIVLTDADANADSPLEQLERYEGMRVSIPTLNVVAPADGNINEASATSTGNGIFYGVLPDVARPMREAGMDVLDPTVVPPGVVPPRFDHNPELIRVRSTGQTGATAINVDVGDSVTGMTGVLDYGFGAYTMTPDPGTGTITLGSVATAVSVKADDEITIGGFNLLHFFDDVADGDGATKLTTLAYQNRLKKTGNAICAFTRNPDILGVVEVEHIKALTELAASINNHDGNILFPNSCSENPVYQPYLFEGNDVGGIDVGFLIKTEEVAPGKPRVEVLSIEQIGKDVDFVNPDNSSGGKLNDRPPLVLHARINHANGASQTITVIANHLRSLIDVDSTVAGSNGWPTLGDRVRGKRAQQALYLAQLIQGYQTANPSEKIVLLGDFNAFEFNDGFVDSMGIITGRAAAASEVIRYVASPITTPLTNMASLSKADERYSFSFDGNAQSLDHMVVNQAVLDGFAGVRSEHARINADFGIDNYGDFTIPVRVSDHDPVVLFLTEASFDTADLDVSLKATAAQVIAGNSAQFTVHAGNRGIDTAHGVKLDFSIAVLPATVSVTPAAGWTCGAPVADGASATLVHCNRDDFDSGSNDDFTVNVSTDVSQNGSNLSLGAAISSSATDPAPGNNSASANVAVVTGTDLRVAIIGPKGGALKIGQTAHYQISVENAGGFAAELGSFQVTVNLPQSALSWAVVDGNDLNECSVIADSPESSTVYCDLAATYPPGAHNTIGFDFTPQFADGNADIVFEANTSALTSDPDAGNNFASLTLRVPGHSVPKQPVDRGN